MNLNNYRKKILICVLTAVLICSLTLCVCLSFTHYDAQGVLGETGINDEYAIGEEISISSATVTVNGQDYSVQPVVYLPDGTAVSAKKLSLDVLGKYVLDYSVKVDGKMITNEKEFFVRQYTAENTSSGKPLTYEQNAVYGTEGIVFNVSAGESARYNKMIDLSKATKDAPFIVLDAQPKTSGIAEARDLFVKITDAYDTTNYITIKLSYSPDPGAHNANIGYVRASAYGQTLAGRVTDDWIDFDTQSSYGAAVSNGLKGYYESSSESKPIEYYLDYYNATLYCKYNDKLNEIINLAEYNTITYGGAKLNGNNWTGFTTGEAYISVYAERYEAGSTSFNGVILNIFDENLKDGVDENGNLPLLDVSSTTSPVIDFGEYKDAENMYGGIVGLPYKLPEAKLLSVYDNSSLYTQVYFGYNTSSRYEIPVIDGAFTPDIAGIYTVRYSAVDCFGNVAYSTFDVKVVNGDDYQFIITAPDNNAYLNGVAGYALSIIPANELTLSGNMGFVDVNVSATNKGNGNVVSVVGDSFIPDAGGEWIISYSAVDALGRLAKYEYSAQVTVSEKVLFMPVDGMYKYMIVGAKNPIPNAQVIDYNAGGKIKNAEKISVKKGDEEIAVITDGYFTPTASGHYTIVYESVSAVNVAEYKTFDVLAVDVGFGNRDSFSLSKYFYSSASINAQASSAGVALTVKTNEIVDFIRPVDGVNFTMDFKIGNLVNADSIEIVLTDVDDSEQSVKFAFKKIRLTSQNKDVVAVSINGGEWKTLNFLTFNEDASVNVVLSDGELSIGEANFEVSTYQNGNKYEGFGSKTVYMSMCAVGQNGSQYEFIVNNITGQTMNATKEDKTSPRMIISGSTKNRLLKGEKMTITAVKFIDVIDPYVIATFSLTDKNNAAVKDVNGLLLDNVDVEEDYTVKFDLTGAYRKKYTYLDSTGNGDSKGKAEIINVVSVAKPVIEIDGESKSVSLNETVKVFNASASSPDTEDVKLYIFIKAPYGNMKELEKYEDGENEGMYKMEFVASLKGDYLIRYMAIDQWSNISINEYTVTVK